MPDFPYTPNPASLRRFFEKIPSTGVPDKVTLQVLNSLGFTSSNDRYILPVLKALKFVDGSGVPTQVQPGLTAALVQNPAGRCTCAATAAVTSSRSIRETSGPRWAKRGLATGTAPPSGSRNQPDDDDGRLGPD